MALPLIVAGIVARAVAKKIATRTVAGIAGVGAKSVNSVYKMNAASSKKQLVGYTAGFAATTAWIGSEVYKAENKKNKSKYFNR